MTLLAAASLDPKKFFRGECEPARQGSSFDLTIGGIFNSNGRRADGPFVLKPGHMVQVMSAEIFDLPSHITGHVTYKTTLTSNGIWALTVGIVDPGWNGPISTTLLNFSRIDHLISVGDPFLRVSFFEHTSVPESRMRKAPPVEDYLRNVQNAAASTFPETFLDNKEIARRAGETAVAHLGKQALIWVSGIALLFALIQSLTPYLQPSQTSTKSDAPMQELAKLRNELDAMRQRLKELEQSVDRAP